MQGNAAVVARAFVNAREVGNGVGGQPLCIDSGAQRAVIYGVAISIKLLIPGGVNVERKR